MEPAVLYAGSAGFVVSKIRIFRTKSSRFSDLIAALANNLGSRSRLWFEEQNVAQLSKLLA